MTVYVENPQDYVGKHRFSVDESLTVTLTDVSLAPLAADDRWEIGDGYEPRHYAGYPYVTYVNGKRVDR